MPRIPNKTVVQQLKEGNPLGCHHLLQLYQEKLIGEGVRVFDLILEDAEELVGDVLLTVVQKINDFEFKRGDGDFHLWVMTIFRNRVRDLVRHQATTEGLAVPFDEGDSGEGQYSASEQAVINEIVRQYQDSLRADADDNPKNRKLQIITETLEMMEPWERVLLRCRALDVPYEDIATYTGKPVKQLKVYHARVKKKFAKMLSEKYPEFTHHVAEIEADETRSH